MSDKTSRSGVILFFTALVVPRASGVRFWAPGALGRAEIYCYLNRKRGHALA